MEVGTAPAVSFDDVTKYYGAIRANEAITFSVLPGTIHAIVGENGAGKSTLVKMLAGLERPDAGRIRVLGTQVDTYSPRASAGLGVGLVHQELSLAGGLTVWENVVLGWEPTRRGWLGESRVRRRLQQVAADFGLSDVLGDVTETLSLSTQQRVEIAKVLYRGAEVIVLDEPTAILTPSETVALFAALKALAAAGKTVIFISHKLHEVLELAETITVLRDATHVVTIDAAGVDRNQLAELIVGRALPPLRTHEQPPGDVVLEVQGLSAEGRGAAAGIDDVTLAVRAGRVLGIAGVSGNGQDALVEAIVGLRPVTSGSVTIHGSEADTIVTAVRADDRVRVARDAGVGYIPVDRRGTGSAAGQPLWFSSLAGRFWHDSVRKRHLLDLGGVRTWTREVIAGFQVKAQSEEVRPHELSGGNLQKYIVGREFSDAPRIVIAEDPTRGVDIGSAMDIRQRLLAMCEQGCAVLLVSTDLDELLELSDEVEVIFKGRLSRSFSRATATAETLGRAMTGLEEALADEGGDTYDIAVEGMQS